MPALKIGRPDTKRKDEQMWPFEKKGYEYAVIFETYKTDGVATIITGFMVTCAEEELILADALKRSVNDDLRDSLIVLGIDYIGRCEYPRGWYCLIIQKPEGQPG